MATLGIGVTANQNSMPNELVFDVDVMLAGRLDSVAFPFLGADAPEGHQRQSVEGMSHGCVLAQLEHGFHTRRLPWSFKADHQPIGGRFDKRENQLLADCLLASSITFDLSPELAKSVGPDSPKARAAWVSAKVESSLVATVQARVAGIGFSLDPDAFHALHCQVWPAMRKMQTRDAKYQPIRARHFTTTAGRAYLRELSIDELPGLTTPETTAIMLSRCEAMGMPVSFVAAAVSRRA